MGVPRWAAGTRRPRSRTGATAPTWCRTMPRAAPPTTCGRPSPWPEACRPPTTRTLPATLPTSLAATSRPPPPTACAPYRRTSLSTSPSQPLSPRACPGPQPTGPRVGRGWCAPPSVRRTLSTRVAVFLAPPRRSASSCGWTTASSSPSGPRSPSPAPRRLATLTLSRTSTMKCFSRPRRSPPTRPRLPPSSSSGAATTTCRLSSAALVSFSRTTSPTPPSSSTFFPPPRARAPRGSAARR
mmetsp:Transcript_20554/g.49506  ORF Transcript_20554/g.49506 Transcript_20554/m.49506 type:complete len:241 (-) Transcript_20554:10823-11545(-)